MDTESPIIHTETSKSVINKDRCSKVWVGVDKQRDISLAPKSGLWKSSNASPASMCHSFKVFQGRNQEVTFHSVCKERVLGGTLRFLPWESDFHNLQHFWAFWTKNQFPPTMTKEGPNYNFTYGLSS